MLVVIDYLMLLTAAISGALFAVGDNVWAAVSFLLGSVICSLLKHIIRIK